MVMSGGLRAEPCSVLTLRGGEGKEVPGKETEKEQLPRGIKRSQEENASRSEEVMDCVKCY